MLALGGVLPAARNHHAAAVASDAPLPASAVPRDVAARAQARCAGALYHNASRDDARHSLFNHRNGARGKQPLRVTYEALEAIDARLVRELRALAAELGYRGT